MPPELKKEYYSNGKLLLTGEYLVMHGAKALAFPVKFGQNLEITADNQKRNTLYWKAYEIDNLWFEAEFSLSSLNIITTNSKEKANYLKLILQKAKTLNPEFLFSKNGISVTTKTDFPINWGLGTSSTLINNIAQWASVNAFELHRLVSNGSGYDIACATSKSPIIYQRMLDGKPFINHINFDKSFLNHIYFIYSGKKKRTEQHISRFAESNNNYSSEIEQIDSITDQLIQTDSLLEFIALLKEHERIIGNVLDWKPIGDDRFACFNGVVKSLGAWGGDFLLVVSPKSIDYVQSYFEQNGLSVIIPYTKMILNH